MILRATLLFTIALVAVARPGAADEAQPDARSLFIEGYPDQLSYLPGENVRLHVSTTAPTVHRPDHWLFAGTGVKQGDKFGGKNTIVGYECDGCEIDWQDNLPSPTHRDGTPETFVILGTCPARWHPDDALWYDCFPRDQDGAPKVGSAVMGVYTRGGTVFTAGTTDWSHGLTGDDKVVEQITWNVLDRLGK